MGSIHPKNITVRKVCAWIADLQEQDTHSGRLVGRNDNSTITLEFEHNCLSIDDQLYLQISKDTDMNSNKMFLLFSCCDKKRTKTYWRVCFGWVCGYTVYPDRECMVLGAWDKWSHCIHSQETETNAAIQIAFSLIFTLLIQVIEPHL